MSFFNLFGRKKKQKPAKSTPANTLGAIKKLKGQVSNLEKRIELLDNRAQKLTREALQKKRAGDRKGALFKLKQKKLAEKERDQLYSQVTNLETQLSAIESAATTKSTVDAMRVGKNALQDVNTQIDVENVELMKEEITEGMDDLNEVTNILGESLGGYEDEGEYEDELNELMEQDAEDDLLNEPSIGTLTPGTTLPPALPTAPTDNITPTLNMPEAPTTTPVFPDPMNVAATDEQDSELAALEDMMS